MAGTNLWKDWRADSKLIIFFLLLIFLATTVFLIGCESGKEKNKPEKLLLMDEVHKKKLKEAQMWFIKEGVPGFYKTRDSSHIEEYVKTRGYGRVFSPSINTYRTLGDGRKFQTLARFIIYTSRTLENQVWCFAQEEHQGIVYEYWMMKEYARIYGYKECTFMISRADSLESPREIIHSSNQFFSSYKINEDFSIQFPVNSVVSLRVGSYSHCFQQTDMKEIVEILERIK